MRRLAKATAALAACYMIVAVGFNAGAATTPHCHELRAQNPAAVCGVNFLAL